MQVSLMEMHFTLSELMLITVCQSPLREKSVHQLIISNALISVLLNIAQNRNGIFHETENCAVVIF